MKSDGGLTRCPLKGTIGDPILVVLCGCGHYICKILAHLRALITRILTVLRTALSADAHQPNPQIVA